MSQWLPQATVSIEDRRYWQHGGVDYVGIARALWRDLTPARWSRAARRSRSSSCASSTSAGADVRAQDQGGLPRDQAQPPKWSKPGSSRAYLNSVYYGNHAYGVEAAAQTYFSRHAKELTLLQAALLAGLPQAPSDYDPFHSPPAAIARRDEVLRAMLREGRRSLCAQYNRASARNSLGSRPGRIYTRIKQPYFFSYVLESSSGSTARTRCAQGGLRVYTTIEPRYQRPPTRRSATRSTVQEGPGVRDRLGRAGTGAIRAMTAAIPGNAHNQFNLAAQSRGKAGSTFKTFVLAAAIEKGINPDYDLLHLGAVHLHDRPVRRHAGEPWNVADLRPQLSRLDVGHARDAPVRQHHLRAADARRRPG